MKVEMGKKYRTRDGRDVRILTTDLRNPELTVAVAVTHDDGPSLRESLWMVTAEGRFWTDQKGDHPLDLIEVSPYDDFKIGEPVMAKCFPACQVFVRRYFAGVTKDGRPMVFNDGLTQWTADGRRTVYASVRRPTKEELK